LSASGLIDAVPELIPESQKLEKKIQSLQTRAQRALEKRGHDSRLVCRALALIEARAIKIPVSANYYLVAFEALSPEDLQALEMSPEAHDAHTARISLTREVVETAARTGRSASDVLQERLSEPGVKNQTEEPNT
jgi:hypothetical protein